MGHKKMEKEIEDMCEEQVPGDTHRDLEVDTEFSKETFKHILAPVWLLSYQFRDKTFQVVVNGFTGKIAGRYPKSITKIFFFTLAMLILALLFYVMFCSNGSSTTTHPEQ